MNDAYVLLRYKDLAFVVPYWDRGKFVPEYNEWNDTNYSDNHEYMYESHFCPHNLMSQAIAVFDLSDKSADPHGIFKLESIVECSPDLEKEMENATGSYGDEMEVWDKIFEGRITALAEDVEEENKERAKKAMGIVKNNLRAELFEKRVEGMAYSIILTTVDPDTALDEMLAEWMEGLTQYDLQIKDIRFKEYGKIEVDLVEPKSEDLYEMIVKYDENMNFETERKA